MKKVTHVQPFGEGFMAHAVNALGTRIQIPIWEARCGIAGPTQSHLTYYYVILGQRKGVSEIGKEPILFLAEAKCDSQSALFEKLTDDLNRLRCKAVYADRTGDKDFFQLVWQQIKPVSVNTRLMPAPFAENVPQGKALILEWLKDESLLIPKSQDTVLRKELMKLSEEVGNESPVLNAIRFVLAGFVKYPPLKGLHMMPSRSVDPGGWT